MVSNVVSSLKSVAVLFLGEQLPAEITRELSSAGDVVLCLNSASVKHIKHILIHVRDDVADEPATIGKSLCTNHTSGSASSHTQRIRDKKLDMSF